jgi:hypothetical protein
MTVDERLELHQNIKSLHAAIREARERTDRLDARERQGRQAMLAALRAYLENGGESGDQ